MNEWHKYLKRNEGKMTNLIYSGKWAAGWVMLLYNRMATLLLSIIFNNKNKSEINSNKMQDSFIHFQFL